MFPQTKKNGTKGIVRRWHRRIGLVLSCWLILLAVTGFLLNHSDDFSLHQRYVQSDWIINLYHLKAPANPRCFKSNSNQLTLCQIGNQVYHQNQWLMNIESALIGFYEDANYRYLITRFDVIIYTQKWQLVEHFTQQNELPGKIDFAAAILAPEQTSHSVNLLVIKTAENFWVLNQDFIWKSTPAIAIETQNPMISAEKNKVALQQNYLKRQITLLHFLQDLHSARLFSLFGKWLTDLVALLVILLTISGLTTWLKRHKQPI